MNDTSDGSYARDVISPRANASRGPGATLHVTEQPPLMQMVSRVRAVRAEVAQTIDDLMRTQESSLACMIGPVPKAEFAEPDKRVIGYGGHYGELELAIVELESMAYMMMQDVRAQVYRLTNVT